MLVDSLVMIEFWDHCRGTARPVLCRAVGWVKEATDAYITIYSWQPAPGCSEDDNDLLSIVRPGVVSVRQLVPGPLTKENPMAKGKCKGGKKGGK